jgi:nudix-type nucleoside diphosphatase (YffH/AdpP family)
MTQNDVTDRVRLKQLTVLSENHYVLRKAEYDFRRRDGEWQAQARESYDMGDGAAVLPVDRAKGLVLLIRQFRWPVFEAGHRKFLIEAVAGKLDGDEPEACVRREAREEAGVTLGAVRQVFHCFMSPGAVKERISLFVADYDSTAPRSKSGGNANEGEDIEVLELTLDQALAMIAACEIIDAKTIMLLQHLRLETNQGD